MRELEQSKFDLIKQFKALEKKFDELKMSGAK
jgi:hypothetical protein